MNKYPSSIIIMLICVACFTVGLLTHIVFSPPRVPVPAAQAGPGHTFEDLLDAIEWVESRGDADAKGDWVQWVNKEAGLFEGEYRAVGTYQIHKIYVDDVNRIAGTRYTYNDRLNRSCSREMTRIYLKHYGGTFEEMARKHNGGPTGHKKESTKPYWAKVQARLMTKEIK